MRFDRTTGWRASVLLMAALAATSCAPASGRPPADPIAYDSPPNAGAAVLVEVIRPARQTIVQRVELVATLEPWEQAVVYAKVSGYLKSISVDRGDRVRKGELLAVLDIPEMDDEYQKVEAQEQRAVAEIEKARADVRLQELIANRLDAIRSEEPGATTQQEVDIAAGRLAAAQASLSAARSRGAVVRGDKARLTTLMGYSRVTAPFDGTITERHVDVGALVTAGTESKPTPILEIVNASKLRAMVDVPETDLPHLQQGDTARLRVSAYPDKTFDGMVSRFSGALGPKTRTLRTEVLIANSTGVLRPEMFGSLSLDLERREGVLTVPPASLHFEQGQAYVLVAERGYAHRVNVGRGVDDGNIVEIVSGLDGTESLIANAAAALADGAAITVVTPPDSTATEGR